MRPYRAVALITLTALLTSLTSCVSTRLPPISSAGDSFEPLRDEKRLWAESAEEEAQLLDEVTLYDDPLLEDYLAGIAERLQPNGLGADAALTYRVRVIEDPTLNAFAYAHGSLYVHTGLLARIQSESQLATVLAHEMTHIENRHMLRLRRSARNKRVGWSIASFAGAVIFSEKEYKAARRGRYGRAATYGVLRDVLVGLGLELAFVASVNGYGRDLEWEADRGSLLKMADAGYELNAATEVYATLAADEEDTDSRFERFFFGDHPALEERIDNVSQFLTDNPALAETAQARTIDHDHFERRIRPVLRDDAIMNIAIGRFDLAEDQLFRALELMPDDPKTHALVGRLRQAQAEETADDERLAALLNEAEMALREAIRLDPNRPDPHREMGLLAYRNGAFETACTELRLYVELEPRADDTSRMQDYVLELEDEGHCRRDASNESTEDNASARGDTTWK